MVHIEKQAGRRGKSALRLISAAAALALVMGLLMLTPISSSADTVGVNTSSAFERVYSPVEANVLTSANTQDEEGNVVPSGIIDQDDPLWSFCSLLAVAPFLEDGTTRNHDADHNFTKKLLKNYRSATSPALYNNDTDAKCGFRPITFTYPNDFVNGASTEPRSITAFVASMSSNGAVGGTSMDFKVPEDGYYMYSITVSPNPNENAKALKFRIVLNDQTDPETVYPAAGGWESLDRPSGTGAWPVCEIAPVFYAKAGDVISVQAYASTQSSTNIMYGAPRIVKLNAAVDPSDASLTVPSYAGDYFVYALAGSESAESFLRGPAADVRDPLFVPANNRKVLGTENSSPWTYNLIRGDTGASFSNYSIFRPAYNAYSAATIHAGFQFAAAGPANMTLFRNAYDTTTPTAIAPEIYNAFDMGNQDTVYCPIRKFTGNTTEPQIIPSLQYTVPKTGRVNLETALYATNALITTLAGGTMSEDNRKLMGVRIVKESGGVETLVYPTQAEIDAGELFDMVGNTPTENLETTTGWHKSGHIRSKDWGLPSNNLDDCFKSIEIDVQKGDIIKIEAFSLQTAAANTYPRLILGNPSVTYTDKLVADNEVAVTTDNTAGTTGGNVSLPAFTAANLLPGASLTATVAPVAGYRLKAGMLWYKYTRSDGVEVTRPLYSRVGSMIYEGRADGQNNETAFNDYTFKMPNMATNLQIIADFVSDTYSEGDVQTKKDEILRVFGTSYNRNSPGLQFGSRVYREIKVGGKTYKLDSMGTKLYSKRTGEYKTVPATTLLDRTDVYVDYAARITFTGDVSKNYTGELYSAQAYANYVNAEDPEDTLELLSNPSNETSYKLTKANAEGGK